MTALTIPVAAVVRNDHGFGNYTVGVIEAHDLATVIHGNRGFYMIRTTGGCDMFGKPAKVGEVRRVHHSHVRIAA